MWNARRRQFVEKDGRNLSLDADYNAFDIDDPAHHRRSVYRFICRSIPDPFMTVLDCPDGNELAPRRTVSITSLQALAMMNDRFLIRQSEHIAARLAVDAADLKQQTARAYLLILHRPPEAEELEAMTAYAQEHGMANACRLLLNTNEFMFVE